MLLDEALKTDMGMTVEKMKKLDFIGQVIIASKIDALFEKQMVDEANAGGGGGGSRPGERIA